MKPWREICVPHPDVLQGTFQQSEFAADITAVREGKASREYQDAAGFYQRTFITEGMRLLLTQVAQRLNGKGGEPVIQLQTAFGGGKTHTMLAVYHLASRSCGLKDLAGIPPLLDQAKLMDVPKAAVAVLDGNAHAPGQPWSHGKVTVNTLWGELAWQLGGEEGLAMVRESDTTGTSPGKSALGALLERFAPCVVLVDELVAYVRQFPDGQKLSGGTYDSNLSFIQALTEAAKLVPTAIVLASLPESEVEAGSSRGIGTLKALEKMFGRIQALWKPVATEEAFEIVRRRLFEPIRDASARDAVCREFAKAYAAEGNKLPSETHEARYYDRLVQAYPIHPEVFDRLFEDWTTLDGFQRTRGVLKLMARTIYRLWLDQSPDFMILPGSLPLADSGARDELLYYLPPGWDAVVESDIDGERAEATDIDRREPRFGSMMAARRVARTLFFGSAPSTAPGHKGTRGMDRARVLLGCVQPGQPAAAFSDALNRLCDRLHYLGSSGDKQHDTTRFWFDTRANLRREMEDRKGRLDPDGEVRTRIAEVVKKLGAGPMFDGLHVFTPSADVPDDSGLRLVVLPPETAYSKQDPKPAFAAVLDFTKNHGTGPRYRGNRLVFIAADQASLSRLRDCVCTALAWESIVTDIKARRLNVDGLQEDQAKKEMEGATSVLPKVARECFKWLLCPAMTTPTDKDAMVEAYALKTSSGSYPDVIAGVCDENGLVITKWSPIHLGTCLAELYWKAPVTSVRALAVWEDMQKYLYMARLRDRSVLEQVIIKGAATKDFFGTAYGLTDATFQGFKLGDANVQLDDTLLLIEPKAAAEYAAVQAASAAPAAGATGAAPGRPATGGHANGGDGAATPTPVPAAGAGAPRHKAFFGSVEVRAATAKMKLVELADEVISVLAADPTATIKVTLEVSAEFAGGVSEQTKRTVSENATALGFKSKLWE